MGGSAWFVATLVALIGVAAMLLARADTTIVTAEAESGTVAGRAVKLSGNGASGDGFVTFAAPRNYVAIGDSVASGSGIEYGWRWTTDGTGEGSWVRTGPANPVWEPANDLSAAVQACLRSRKAYPYLVAAATGDRLHNPSCSGASAVNGILSLRSFKNGLVGAAQLGSTQTGFAPPSAAYDAHKPDIVTVTVGMDDIGFGEVLEKCYIGASCVTAENEQILNQRLARAKTDLVKMLAEIKARGDAAGRLPSVVLTTYYDPFQPDPNTVCKDTYLGLGNGLGANEITWMRGKLRALNQNIRDSAGSYPKSKLVDMQDVMAGHTFCSADPWVYGISIWFRDFGNPAPFHPTEKGQAAMAARLIPVVNDLR